MNEGGRVLRVAHLLWGVGFGGAERFVADLARSQASRGDVRASVLACGLADGDPALARFVAEGVRALGGGLRSGFDAWPRRIGAIAEALSEADVVHMHGYTPVMGWAASRAGRPVVFTEHGSLGPDPRSISIAVAKHAAKGLYLRNRVSVVACVSDWVAAATRKRYRLDSRSSVRVVADGIDFDLVRAHRSREEVLSDEGVESSAFVIISAARLAAFKRVDRLLDAVAILKPVGRAWILLVAGSGPLEASLRRRSFALGIADHVRLLGFRERVWELMAAADVVVLPSSLEPFGLAVVEAMALGRPVIAFAGSGGPEEIVDAVGGGCVVDGVEALSEVLQQLYSGITPDCLRPVDSARLRSLYDIHEVAAEYVGLYGTALGGRSVGATVGGGA